MVRSDCRRLDGGCSTTVVQQLGMPDRRDECRFVEQRTWQRPTIVADDGRQLQRVHSLQPSTGELGHTTTCKQERPTLTLYAGEMVTNAAAEGLG